MTSTRGVTQRVESLLAYQDTNRATLYRLTEEFLTIDTQHPPGDTSAFIDHIDSILTASGIDTERFAAQAAKTSLVASIPGSGDRTMLYLGLVDTVPFDSAAWTYHPLGELVDDRSYGRRATDMQGGWRRWCSR